MPQHRTINASDFKARCREKRDLPYREKRESLRGIDRGRIQIVGDIVGPVEQEWEADADPDRVLDP